MNFRKSVITKICLVTISSLCTVVLSLKDELAKLLGLDGESLSIFLATIAVVAFSIPIWQSIVEYIEKGSMDKEDNKTIYSQSTEVFALKKVLLKAVQDSCRGIVENEIVQQIKKDNMAANYTIKTTHTFYESTEHFLNNKRSRNDRSRWNIRDNNLGLVFIGEPGSGKTYSMTGYILELIETIRRACPLEKIIGPMPVYLHLSGWDGQSLEEWFVKSIPERYQLSKGKAIVKHLINESQIVPCIDGLDELMPEKRQDCMKHIIDYATKNSIVFCCRRQEFIQLIDIGYEFDQLQSLKIVSLEKLHPNLVERTIKENISNSKQLLMFLDQNEFLYEYLNTPLSLNLSIITLRHFSIQEKNELRNTDQIDFNDKIWDKYDEIVFAKEFEQGAKWTQAGKLRTQTYLAIIATKMTGTSFNLNQLHLGWLPDSFALSLYLMVSGVISGMLLSIGFGFFLATPTAFIGNGILSCVAIAFVTWQVRSRITIKSNLNRLTYVSVFMIALIIITGLYQGFSVPRFNNDSLGAFAVTESLTGIFLGVLFGCIFGFRKIRYAEKNAGKQQSIKESNKYRLNYSFGRLLTTSLRSGLISFLVYSAAFSCFTLFFNRQPEAFVRSLMMGLGMGIISFLWFGGIDIIEHWALRICLYVYGIIPIMFEKWVSDVSRLGLLRKLDGNVMFQHATIQAHYIKEADRIKTTDVKKTYLIVGSSLLFLSFFYLIGKPFINRYISEGFWKKPAEILVSKDYLSSNIKKVNNNVFVIPKNGFLQIKIDGKVNIGTLIGKIGPEGTETGMFGFRISHIFNKVSTLSHGSLMYKVQNGRNAEWFALIKHEKIIFPWKKRIACIAVNKGDSLYFNINDVEWQNNSGHFKLYMYLSDSCNKRKIENMEQTDQFEVFESI